MVAPALIYLALNDSGEPRRGFGVPTATDIAFAVGVLALLGKRVPPALRVLLLALAIIDDIGAILIIAAFYSSGLNLSGLVIASAGVVMVVLFQRFGIRRALVYVVPGIVVWGGLLHAGIHPTIAGVVLGLLPPVRAWFGKQGFVEATREAVETFDERRRGGHGVEDLLRPLHRIKHAHREALAPVVRIQSELHSWVAFGIMPLFALANSGVRLSGFDTGDSEAVGVLLGVLVGLVVGKPVGIVVTSVAAMKLGICRAPAGVNLRGLAVVGLVAGIGFTMAIFIAGLAFQDAGLLAAAKLAVLLASATSALFGLVVGRLVLDPSATAGAASTAAEAEASADV
jgi:NhaA family Na+:H+ antiporter